MGRATAMWRPSYTISPATARLLMGMETVRTELDLRPLPPAAEAELRRQARVRATHFSTRIEGNRLTLAEAERVVREARTDFHGRERDVREVRNC